MTDKSTVKRKCSMCGVAKEESTNYRFMKKQNRYYCYCNECNRFYNRHYTRRKIEANSD